MLVNKENLRQDPFVNYFQRHALKVPVSSLRQFEEPLDQPRWPMEFMQNQAFSTGQNRKKETCLDFIFPFCNLRFDNVLR